MTFEQRSALHDKFYEEICTHLRDNGFVTASSTYHDHWTSSAVEMMKTRFDPTSFYVRSRADNTAIPRDNRLSVFQWDAKTNLSDALPNMSIELFPLLMHKVNAEAFGVRTLYCYHDIPRDIHAGFWSDALPKIERVMLPTQRWKPQELAWFKGLLTRHLPDVKVYERKGTYGSGTPFALIGYPTIQNLPHWKQLIQKAKAVA